jgi:hypothetical protein
VLNLISNSLGSFQPVSFSFQAPIGAIGTTKCASSLGDDSGRDATFMVFPKVKELVSRKGRGIQVFYRFPWNLDEKTILAKDASWNTFDVFPLLQSLQVLGKRDLGFAADTIVEV